MSTSQICILLTIVVYLVAMVLVGVYCSRKGGGDSSNEFYLGGRKLGPIVTAMSAEASDMSSYLLMGLPGLAYLSGVAEVGWTALGLAIETLPTHVASLPVAVTINCHVTRRASVEL